MTSETFAVHLIDGRVEKFETVTTLDRCENDWIRCKRSEPSPREKLPETTKYYHREDVARIERVTSNGVTQIIPRSQLNFENAICK